MPLHRYCKVGINTVLSALANNAQTLLVNEFSISLTSSRIRTYTKGVTCVCCGVQGEYFAAECSHKFGEQPTGTPHLNLYAIKDGREVLMTSDHIIPKFLGGSDAVDNRQVMCAPCNHAKGHTTDNTQLAIKVLPVRIAEAAAKLSKLSRQQQQTDKSLKLSSQISAAQRTLLGLKKDLAAVLARATIDYPV